MNLYALLSDADAVLSDLDGTLVDSRGPIQWAWEAFARRHGLNPETVISFAQGRPAGETVRLLVPGADGERESALQEQAEVEDTVGIIALPGAAKLLSGNLRVAIVPSCSTTLAHARLGAAGLPVPDTLVTYDDVERGKPDPECFLVAARRLAVDPRRCVVLEDAPAGITAGRLSGAQVVAVRTTHPDAALAGADVIVDDLGALQGA